MVGRKSLFGLLLALAAATGCDRGPAGTMIHLPPPADWEARLAQSRERKDDLMRDPAGSPLLAEDIPTFEGLPYYEPDPDYYFVGRIQYYPEPEKLEITTTAGEQRPGEKIGWISFELDGTVYRLQVYHMLDNALAGFFLPFRDTTAGSETYPSGRYVELDGPQGGPYVLDFNRAYNPSCAYGAPERFACPVTPRENHLTVAIRAGERGYKHESPG